jgi:hypothetical protein
LHRQVNGIVIDDFGAFSVTPITQNLTNYPSPGNARLLERGNSRKLQELLDI